jgi:hypothetical protein
VKWYTSNGKLRTGDLVRFRRGGRLRVFEVRRMGAAGAVIAPTARDPVTINGHTFQARGKEIVISDHAACERLDREDRKTDWRRGVDRRAPGVIESKSRTNNRRSKAATRQGGKTMPAKAKSKVSAAPVPRDRTKKAKTAKKTAAKKAKGTFKCICGCGGTTGGYFQMGHDARFKGWLLKIRRGEGEPKDFMKPTLVKALGPWKKKGAGKIPSKQYQDLR